MQRLTTYGVGHMSDYEFMIWFFNMIQKKIAYHTFLKQSLLTILFHSQEEELSSSSSEEEESDQRPNEDLFGKVVCVEGVATGDKKKTTWYPALVSA